MAPTDDAWSSGQFGANGQPGSPNQFGAPTRFGSAHQVGTPNQFGSPHAAPPSTSRPPPSTSRSPRRRRRIGSYVRRAVLAGLLVGLVVVANDYRAAWDERSSTSVAFPATVEGLTLVNTPESLAASKETADSFTGLSSGTAEGATYARPGGTIGAVVFGQRKRLPLVPFGLRKESRNIVDTLVSLSQRPSTISDVIYLESGKLGGRLVCGTLSPPRQNPTRICAGDNATSIFSIAYDHLAVPDASVVAMREAIIKQS